MKLTYNDLEELSGVARNTLLQWKHRSFLDGEFNEALALRAMWLGELSQRGVPVGQAFELYVEALRKEGTIVVLTVDGPKWLSDDAYKKALVHHFDDSPFFFAVAWRHFVKQSHSTLETFTSVKKMRNKIGLSTENVGEPMSPVHVH